LRSRWRDGAGSATLLKPEACNDGDQAERYPLSVVEGTAEGVGLLGIAKEIVEEPHGRIQDQIEPDDRAGPMGLADSEIENDEDDRFGESFIKLRRMQRDSLRNA